MKLLLLLLILVVLALAICIFIPAQSRVDRRAWLTMSKSALKSADDELHKLGTFTNRFQMLTVYPYTNRFSIDGIDYQCELAANCERLTNRGFLAITTNQVFVWIGTKGSLLALTNTGVRPPGF